MWMYIVILTQIIIIIGISISLVKKTTIHPVYINPLLGKSLVSNNKSNLKYYFEPASGSISFTNTNWATVLFRRNKDGGSDMNFAF